MVGRDALWRQVIEKKYGSTWGSHGTLSWNKFASFIRFDVGDGTRVRCWHGDSSFLEKYPELFYFLETDARVVCNILHIKGKCKFSLESFFPKSGSRLGG